MRNCITISFFCIWGNLFGQSIGRNITTTQQTKFTDTCDRIKIAASANAIRGTNYSQALYVANDIIVAVQELNASSIESVSVVKCPESFYRFGYAGVNGAILIKTHQEFQTITPGLIRKKKCRKIEGPVFFALNGCLLTATTQQISKNAIKEIQLVLPGTKSIINSNYKNSTGINIWTLSKDERKPLSALCRGLGVSQE